MLARPGRMGIGGAHRSSTTAPAARVASTSARRHRDGPAKRAVAGGGARADRHRNLGAVAAAQPRRARRRPARPLPSWAPCAARAGDEFFVDPAEFRRGRAAAPGRGSFRSLPPAAGRSAVELFVTPEEFKQDARQTPCRRPRAAAGRCAAAACDSAATAADATEGRRSGFSALIRVATEKVDLLVNLVGELVITQAMLARQARLSRTGTAATASKPAWPTWRATRATCRKR